MTIVVLRKERYKIRSEIFLTQFISTKLVERWLW